jgi:hypothetical protein
VKAFLIALLLAVLASGCIAPCHDAAAVDDLEKAHQHR